MSFSSEIDLLLKASRLQPPNSLDESLQKLPDDFDWTVLVQTALEHGVSGILCHNLLDSDPDLVPDEIRQAAQDHLAQLSAANQEKADQFSGILSRLDDAGIETIPFKGPTLAMSAYGQINLRVFGDLDFLIKYPDIPTCLDLLSELGYKHDWDLTPRQWQEFVNYAGEDILFGPGIPIEPHWAFAPGTLALKLDYPGIWKRTGRSEFNGQMVNSLSPEDELIVLCIHGCKEQWVKLKWVADVAAFIDSHPQINWEFCFELAARQGVARILKIGLFLSKKLLGYRLDQKIEQWMVQDRFAGNWCDQIAKEFFTAGKPALDIWKPGYFHWSMRERLRDRLSYFFRTITQPRVQYFADIRIPDRLFFLYWPYRVIHDFMLLPAWKLVKR